MEAVQGESLRPPIDVFVLVPVQLYRDGIADAVARDARFRTVGTAAALGEAREQLTRLERPPNERRLGNQAAASRATAARHAAKRSC